MDFIILLILLCGCRKTGLKCSILCHNCSGESCENVVAIGDLLDEDDIGSDENRSEQVTPEPPELPDSFIDDYEKEPDDENEAGPSTKRSKYNLRNSNLERLSKVY